MTTAKVQMAIDRTVLERLCLLLYPGIFEVMDVWV